MENKQVKEQLKRVEFALRIKREHTEGKVLLTNAGKKEIERILRNA